MLLMFLSRRLNVPPEVVISVGSYFLVPSVKATTDQNKSTTKNAVVNTQGIADEIQMSAQPTKSRKKGRGKT